MAIVLKPCQGCMRVHVYVGYVAFVFLRLLFPLPVKQQKNRELWEIRELWV